MRIPRGRIGPIPEAKAAVNADIAADSDARELAAEWFTKAQPASEVLPPLEQFQLPNARGFAKNVQPRLRLLQ